jgi:hypothetical protein
LPLFAAFAASAPSAHAVNRTLSWLPPPLSLRQQGYTASATETLPAATLEKRAPKPLRQLPFIVSGFGQVEWTSLPGSNSTFALRSARILIRGRLGAKAHYRLQADAASSPALLDAFLTLGGFRCTSVAVGQFRIPFSQENLRASNHLLTVDRSQVVNSLVRGSSSGRDIGAQLAGSFRFHQHAGLDYAAGLFNGSGIGVKDDNNRKAFVGRLVLRPLPGLQLAADDYNGAATARKVPRDQQEGESSWSFRRMFLASEFIRGRDGTVREQGWYALAAWRFSSTWQGVFRIDAYDPDRSTPHNTTTDSIGGFNWFFAPGLKWQLNCGMQNKQNRNRGLLLSQLQFSF